MGKKFLIDTNVVIDFLMNRLPPEGAQWFIEKVNNREHCLSPINQIELLGFNGDPKELARVSKFIAGTVVIPIEEKVIAQTILVRRPRKIKLPDAIIAATAVVHELKIISRNEKDFRNIQGVEFLNLHSL